MRVLICLFVLFCIFGAACDGATIRAVLVGINQYEIPAGKSAPANASRKSWTDLDGAVTDAEEMKQILVSRFHLKNQDIHVLTNQAAIRASVLTEIKQHLLQEASRGDTSIFFYAGHGSQRFNSQSQEPDKMDETLVPADSNRGADDIRDKELSKLFDDIVDKGVLLTVILDSCHSGSAARGPGKERRLPPDLRDIHDPDTPAPPEQKGALVISAAQDFESAWEALDERGDPHGAFTYALLKTLRTAGPAEPAERIFQRARALMQSEGARQEPVLAALPFRRNMPLFGGVSEGTSEMTVAVEKVLEPDTVLLQGGRALNLDVDCELRRLAASGQEAVRVRVTSVEGLVASKAKVITGNIQSVQPGDLFVVDRWVTPPEYSLKVWIPPPLSEQDLQEAIAEMKAVFSNGTIRQIQDPAQATPNALLTFESPGWVLFTPDGRSLTLGKKIDAPSVLKALQAFPGAGLFWDLPPSTQLAGSLSFEQTSAVRPVVEPGEAQYVLAGRAQGASNQYSWILAGALQKEVQDSNLPIRTDWIDASAAAGQLADYALRLGKIRAWTTIDSPPDEGAFPYRLMLKNAATGEILSGGTVHEGDRLGLILQMAGEKRKVLEKRWVYVFAIDSNGGSSLLFPRGGGVENRIPYGDEEDALPEIALGAKDLLEISAPFGIDNYILLTTTDPLADPGLLEFDGVRKEQARGMRPDTLEFLLLQKGTGTRGVAVTTQANWSVQRFSIRSVKKEQ